jgi:hypothetical protein
VPESLQRILLQVGKAAKVGPVAKAPKVSGETGDPHLHVELHRKAIRLHVKQEGCAVADLVHRQASYVIVLHVPRQISRLNASKVPNQDISTVAQLLQTKDNSPVI